MAPGWRAIIYSGKDFLGESLEITADVPNLQTGEGVVPPRWAERLHHVHRGAWRRRPGHADVRVWSWLLSFFQRTEVPAEATRVTKSCVVMGCDGTMAFDDTEYGRLTVPGFVTAIRVTAGLIHGDWEQRQQVMKACTLAGCRGVMTETNFTKFTFVVGASWRCDVDSDHEEFELAGKIYRREDLVSLRADMSHRAIDKVRRLARRVIMAATASQSNASPVWGGGSGRRPAPFGVHEESAHSTKRGRVAVWRRHLRARRLRG